MAKAMASFNENVLMFCDNKLFVRRKITTNGINILIFMIDNSYGLIITGGKSTKK